MNVGVFATVQIVGELTLDFFPKRFFSASLVAGCIAAEIAAPQAAFFLFQIV